MVDKGPPLHRGDGGCRWPGVVMRRVDSDMRRDAVNKKVGQAIPSWLASFWARPMRCSLPVAPFGISSMKRIFFGTL